MPWTIQTLGHSLAIPGETVEKSGAEEIDSLLALRMTDGRIVNGWFDVYFWEWCSWTGYNESGGKEVYRQDLALYVV